MEEKKTKKILIRLSLVLLAISSFLISSAIAQLTADEIIEKSIQAQGGREAIEKIKDSVVTATCKLYRPQGELLMERKVYSKSDPLKIRIEQNLLGMQIIIGYDGEKTWLQQMGKTMVAPEAIHNSFKASALRENLLLKYKQKRGRAECLGESLVEDKKCYQVKISGPELGETIYYFESENFLPIKTEFIAPDESGKMVRNELISSDFRKVENILIAFKTTTYIEGRKAMEINIQEVKYNVGLEDAFSPCRKNKIKTGKQLIIPRIF